MAKIFKRTDLCIRCNICTQITFNIIVTVSAYHDEILSFCLSFKQSNESCKGKHTAVLT